FQSRSIEDWCSEFLTCFLSSPSQYGLEDLSDVHTGWHTKWVQHDVHWSSVFQERHILVSNDTGNDPLVTVTTRHLITHLQLALLGVVYFGKFHNTCIQFIPYFQRKSVTLEKTGDFIARIGIVLHQFHDQ